VARATLAVKAQNGQAHGQALSSPPRERIIPPHPALLPYLSLFSLFKNGLFSEVNKKLTFF